MSDHGEWPQLVADRLDQLAAQLVGWLVAGTERDERLDDLATELVRHAGDARLGDRRVAEERGLDLDRPDPVVGDLDDLVSSTGEPDIAVGVHVRGVPDVVATRDPLPVVADVALGLAPQRRDEAGERPFDPHDPLLPYRDQSA